MAIEKRWTAAPPVFFTAPGDAQGVVKVQSTARFKVKMEVVLNHPSLEQLALEVKRINSDSEMELGLKAKGHDHRQDLSAYDASTVVSALEQSKNNIPVTEMDRASYEEEPTNARRVIPVDRYGRIRDWEIFEVTNDPSTHDPIKIVIKLKDESVVREIDLEYDSYGDLIKATKTVR